MNIPAGLKTLAFGTFRWSGLKGTFVIPEGVVSIEDEALCYVSLSHLYLPASLAYMEIGANLLDNPTGDPSNTVIHAPEGSYAAKIAKEAGYTLVIEAP